MATQNNFDTSSTGNNIEFNGCMDTDKSQWEFKDNFQVLQSSGYRTHTVAYYIDNGNVPNADALEFTIKGTVKDMRSWLHGGDVSHWVSATEINKANKAQLIEWVLVDLALNYDTPSLITMESINSHQFKDTRLELTTNKPVQRLITRGYCQGDYAEVWYCPSDLAEAWGAEPKESHLQETFDHLFWDAPVYAVMTINGTEYHYWDMPEYDEYEWNREAFGAYVAEESKIPLEEIMAVLPKELEY